jgi:PAS domain S-box-containing protein
MVLNLGRKTLWRSKTTDATTSGGNENGAAGAAVRMTPGFGWVLDEFPDAVVATTTDGKVLYWSKAAENIFGHTSAEAVGRDMRQLLVPPERLGEENRLLQEALAGQASAYAALRRTKAGALIYVDITRKAVWNDRGEVECVLSIKKDVTARKVVQDAKLVEARFGQLLEAMPDGIIMVNSSGRIVACNRHAERLFRYEPLELRGQPVEILLPERHRRSHLDHRAQYLQRPRARPMGVAVELIALRKDGSELPVEISLSPLETDEGLLISSAIRDITERKRFERALQEKNAQLENANRAKGELLATVNNELREPLDTIAAAADRLLRPPTGSWTGEQTDQLELVQARAKDGLRLLDRLLLS